LVRSSLRGKKLADYLLVETADGYRVVFALPEFDASFKQTHVPSQITATAAHSAKATGNYA
jgi:hypothetical protein